MYTAYGVSAYEQLLYSTKSDASVNYYYSINTLKQQWIKPKQKNIQYNAKTTTNIHQ